MEKLRRFKLLLLIIIAFVISIGIGCDKKESIPNPQITSINPNSAKIGENITVNITGAGFMSETKVSFGVGIVVAKVTFNGGETLSVDIEIAESAIAGKRDVVITNPDGIVGNTTTGASMFEIVEELKISSIAPSSAKIGESVTVNLIGAGFKSGTTVSFGSGITVSNIAFVNTASLDVDIVVSGSATAGKRDVVVTNPGGEVVTGASIFEVVQDLNADGFLLYCDYGNGKITKLRISDESIINIWSPSYGDPGSLQGLDFDASNLWLSSGGSSDQIFQLNPTDLTELASINAPPAQTGTVRGIAFDNEGNMWAANSDTPGAIYKLNKADGTMLDTIAGPVSGNDMRGIVFANGILYANDKQEDKVYSYNFTDETWTEVFDIPVPSGVPANRVFPVGMTWDGTNFWIVNSSYEHDYLLQVSPTGELLKSILVEQGAAANAIKLSAIVFTAN